MSMQAEGTESAVPGAVLEAFGVAVGTSLEPIIRGKVNEHWSVRGTDRTLVLRRYTSARTRPAVTWEHELLAYGKSRGWPVAPPVRSRRGGTIVDFAGNQYALFPELPGAPLEYESIPGKAIKGRLLARLHADVRYFPNDGQRPGFARLWELDVFAGQSTGLTFHQLVATFGRDHPDAGQYLRAQRYQNLRELARLGYGELPSIVVHRDFHNDHVLFAGGEFTGILDFDSVCLDAAEADLATTIALECLEGPNFDAIDLRAAAAFLRAYFDHRPAHAASAELIVALVRAHYLWYATSRLGEWYSTLSDASTRSVLRTAERRLPALAARRAGLRDAIAEAAGLRP